MRVFYDKNNRSFRSLNDSEMESAKARNWAPGVFICGGFPFINSAYLDIELYALSRLYTSEREEFRLLNYSVKAYENTIGFYWFRDGRYILRK